MERELRFCGGHVGSVQTNYKLSFRPSSFCDWISNVCKFLREEPVIATRLSGRSKFRARQAAWVIPRLAVSGPTHEKGHTLDLVLSYGVSVSVNEICAMSFSDHSLILFSVSVPCSGSTPSVSKRVSRLINPSTAGQFSAAFNDSPLCRPSLGLSSDYTADQLLSVFSSAWHWNSGLYKPPPPINR